MIDQILPLGKLVATPGALEELENAGEAPLLYVRRHAAGDWGDLCDEDRQLNEEAIENGERVLSSYRLSTNKRIWIITEADRSSTCVLLPSEY